MNSRRKFTRLTCSISLALIILLIWPTFSFALMSIKKEREIGEEVLGEVRRQLKILSDPVTSTYIQKIGKRMLAQAGHAFFEFDFSVVDDPTLNAFAIPGGHIFVNRGLIEIMDREDELAGVLSHEIAHVQARHFAQRVEKGAAISIATLVAAILAMFAGAGSAGGAIVAGAMATNASLMLAYSRADEEEADRLALTYMEKGDYQVSGMASAFKKMEKERWVVPGTIPTYLTTHPGLEDRIGYLESAITSHGAGSDKALNDKRQSEFDQVKVRLIALYDDIPQAQSRLSVLAEKNPDYAIPQYGMGLLFMRMNQDGKAIEAFDRALKLDPGNGLFLRSVGAAYFSLGQLDKAKPALSQALILAPNDPETHFYLGRVYEQEEAWELAISNYEKAVPLADGLDQLYYHMALVDSKLGRLADAHYLFGLHAKKEGNKGNAQFHFQKALTMYQGNQTKITEVEKQLQELKVKPGMGQKQGVPERKGSGK